MLLETVIRKEGCAGKNDLRNFPAN